MGATPTIGGMNIILAGDAKTFSAALDAAEKRIAQLQGKTKGFGRSASTDFASAGASAQRFGHSTVTSVQAASGALRELNGDFTNNIRAVERFITTIPGIGNALKFIYPGVGLIAVGGMVFEISKKISELVKQINEVPKALTRGFGDIHSEARLSADSLAVTNDRLAEQIAKLEHKPVNSLRVALDEDREASDRLSDSLTKSLRKAQDLVEKNKVGFWGTLLGKGDTSAATKFVTDTQAQIDGINSGYDTAVAGASTPENVRAINEARAARLEAVYSAAHLEARKRLRAAQISSSLHGQFGVGSDESGNEAIYGGFDVQMSDQEREVGQSMRGVALQDTLRPLQDKASNDKTDEKAAREKMAGFEQQLARLRSSHDLEIGEEARFWIRMRATTTAGSLAWKEVNLKVGESTQSALREFSSRDKGLEAEARSIAETIAKTNDSMARDRNNTANDTADAQRQLAAVQQGIRAKVEEQGVQDALNRSMTRAAAAAELANIHTREYGAELERLKQKKLQVANDGHITDDDKAKQLGKLAEQQASLEGNRAIQQMQDANANDHSGTSFAIGATDALDELANAARDSAGQMRQFVESTTNSINETILRQITGKGQRGDWTHLGQSVFSNIAGTALKKGEGALLQGFGFGGKADGSETNPLWVRMKSMADKAGGVTSAIAQGATSGLGGFLGKLGPVLSNIPFFADGVDNFGGGMAVVGDAGPELVNLPKGSSVIPNSKAFGPGDTHHHTWNIDARGATDPAQVNRQIMMAAPHIAAAAVKAVHESARRKPSAMR